MKIILASASPRRKELLKNMGIEFEIIPSTKEEIKPKNVLPSELVQNLAEQKAFDIFNQTNGNRLIIGSDTIVVINDIILGKPKDKLDAVNMLTMLSGKTHSVFSGLCVLIERDGQLIKHLTFEKSDITFKKLSRDLIEKYVNTNECLDKAGSYAIQGKAQCFVESISGNVANIIGLPTNKLMDIFLKENIQLFKHN